MRLSSDLLRRCSSDHRLRKALPKPSSDDVVDCGREHLAKLAQIVLRFSDHFPFHSYPRRALTPEGVKALGIDLDDIDVEHGLPRGWTFAPGFHVPWRNRRH
jgi:hypothetical protein